MGPIFRQRISEEKRVSLTVYILRHKSRLLTKIFSEERFIMCAKKDSKDGKVDKSILATSCSNAMKNCSSDNCIREYVKDAFRNRLYKFCNSDFNVMITPHNWGSFAYGLEYVRGLAANEKSYYCIAYCRS